MAITIVYNYDLTSLTFPIEQGYHVLVTFPLFVFTAGLIGLIFSLRIQSGYDYGWNYRNHLAQIYNRTQGGNTNYLDTLHKTFSCCGTSDMKLNVSGDPNLFEPAYNMLTRLPKSCCIEELNEGDQCSFEHIYEKPCDLEHFHRVHVFDMVALSLLIISLVWKLAFHFIYSRSDSLFNEFTKAERIQTIKASA